MKIPHFFLGSKTTCTYCGEPADGIDHVICVASQTIGKRKRVMTGYGPTTASCSECNSAILNSKGFNTFMERCSYVSDRHSRKGGAAHWSEEQLSELGYGLREYIRRDQNRKLWYRFRADWFQGRDFFLGLESLQWEKCLDPMESSYNAELHRYFKSSIDACRAYFARE